MLTWDEQTPAQALPTVARDPIDAFRDAIAAAGLTPPDHIEADGRLHRFSTNGKRSDAAGWYVLHDDGIPAGAFGCWRTGLCQTWSGKPERAMTEAERSAHRERLRAIQREREAEEQERHRKAAAEAARQWEAATPATEHPYLAAKGIQPHIARVLGRYLLVPVYDEHGALMALQRITPDGDKRFLSGGQTKGGFYIIGDVADTLIVAEGYATGASLREATGFPVAVAFNAGNLLPVARALRRKYSQARLVIAADDDWRTDGNPGLSKAREAAQAVGAALAVPAFPPERPDSATDFNDLHQLAGLEAVAACIRAALPDDSACDVAQTGVSEVSGVSPLSDNDLACSPGGCSEVSGVAAGVQDGTFRVPGLERRPVFEVIDDWVTTPEGKRLRPGVWHFGVRWGKGRDPEPELTDTWVCTPLHVEAITSDTADANYGRLLRLRNTHGRWRTWAMPMALLAGRGDELRGALLGLGVEINPHARHLLDIYLQSQHPKRSVTCVAQVGWAGRNFVLPDVVIGPNSASVVFQSDEALLTEYATAGSLADWQQQIGARAVGNPLLVLALCAAFAGPLLGRCHVEGGGVHLVGDSSVGKSTLLEAARSVWGGPSFKRSWRATANGIEGAAGLFNDGLLTLDEISEADPREVGAIVYALTNGVGKARAGRNGAARHVRRWRCVVLSNGERTIATAMAEGGRVAKAGQGVRLLDVPVARAYGAFDVLHDSEDARAFADQIKEAAAKHYGHAGRAFLERLTRDDADMGDLLAQVRALPEFCPPGLHGQEHRATGRFALLALAGELAAEYGIVPWPQGEAVKAAALAFELWRSLRGGGSDERRRIVEAVAAFIDRHGDSRFSEAGAAGGPVIHNRAGWWTHGEAGGRDYLFTASGFAEAAAGFDKARAYDVLVELGAADPPGPDGKRQRFMRIDGRGVKVYRIHAERLGADL